MVIIVGIVAVLILAGLFALIKLTPHKGAGEAQKPHPGHAAAPQGRESRAPGLD